MKKKPSYQSKIQTLRNENRKLRELIQALRAQLCCLRVYNTTANGNVGWMVSAFIPNSAIRKLREQDALRETFSHLIVEALVKNALEGILHKTGNGDVTALLFKEATSYPKKSRKGEYELFGTIYEQSGKIFIHDSPRQQQPKLIEDAKSKSS